MATENVIMAMVDKGFSRQDTHEEIRCVPISSPLSFSSITLTASSVLSHQAGAVVKQEGKPNDLLERIKRTPFFEPVLAELDVLTDPSTFIGRCPEIVDEVIEFDVKPALAKYRDELASIKDAQLNV